MTLTLATIHGLLLVTAIVGTAIAMFATIGTYRMDALVRVWAFIWAWTVGSIVITVVTIIGLLWGIIDVLWQFIINSEGLSEGSRAAEIVTDTLQWGIDLVVYALTGKREFMWFPPL